MSDANREAFEKWTKVEEPAVNLSTFINGAYIYAEAHTAFRAWQAALQHTPQPVTTKPIAAVKGWFHGECVIQALDPSLVLPAGMALYAAPQPVVPEGRSDIGSLLWTIEEYGGAMTSYAMSENPHFKEVADKRMAEIKSMLSAGKGGEQP